MIALRFLKDLLSFGISTSFDVTREVHASPSFDSFFSFHYQRLFPELRRLFQYLFIFLYEDKEKWIIYVDYQQKHDKTHHSFQDLIACGETCQSSNESLDDRISHWNVFWASVFSLHFVEFFEELVDQRQCSPTVA